jgi:NarL family two-component system sensor histidine kinase LiaS
VSDDERVSLPEEARLAVFRVCQEALSNAAKHAEADRVEVYLGVEGGRVVLRVSDDGQGFTEADRRHFPERGSFGLSNMAARAEAVGVDLRITSAPGQGTRVEVMAPLAGNDRPADRRPLSLPGRTISKTATKPHQTA